MFRGLEPLAYYISLGKCRDILNYIFVTVNVYSTKQTTEECRNEASDISKPALLGALPEDGVVDKCSSRGWRLKEREKLGGLTKRPGVLGHDYL